MENVLQRRGLRSTLLRRLVNAVNFVCIGFVTMLHGEGFAEVKIAYYLYQAAEAGIKGALEQCMGYLNRIVALEPENCDAHVGFAIAYCQGKEFRLALEHARRAEGIRGSGIRKSSREMLHLALVVILEMLGEDDAAKEYIDRIAATNDDSQACAYALVGRMYLELRIYEKAEEYYRKLAALGPELSAPYYNLALVYRAENRLDLATAMLKKARELARDRKEVRSCLRQLREIGERQGEERRTGGLRVLV